ncbi:response regulator transcription factor [Chitinophaga nivalis]|uniref:Response regulator transcription factor n=1 Tax=Chitinophaga nivalis TaxID=2991709 RepID=A0ABT3IEU5_9BACT|nr:response regulator transcription factor [Chitinophaga nivalis]MCW3467974.1 response regulator transcription factor [Chitinophaga nivalis]MCW3482335.1 response regulator transcription factor [Chitinophaga nivalis]
MKKVWPINPNHLGEAKVLEVAGLHKESTEVLQQLAKDICNLVIMDIEIPGLTAIEAASIVKAAYPDINVLLLTLNEKGQSVTPVPTVKSGFNVDHIPPVSLSEFIAQVYETALQSNLVAVNKVLAFFRKEKHTYQDPYGLSPREKEILRCLVNGDTYKQVADVCHISVGTVRSHIMNIYRKLDVNSRSNAIVKAMKEQLV